jgi:phosphate transport system substrate-binding protein
VLVQGVAGDVNGSGYFGFSYYEQNADQLSLISVDDGNGCVAPSSETIQAGVYSPLSRPLFMYPSSDALQRPEVAGFVQFVADNYDTIADAALIVPMDESQASETQATVDKAAG